MKAETGNRPADHSRLVSGEMRGQFQAIQNNFDIRVAAFGRKPHSPAGEIGGALPSRRYGLTVSNPPTQADVRALADKLDELVHTLNA